MSSQNITVNIKQEDLISAIRKEKEIQSRREKITLFVLKDSLNVYVENLKESTKMLLELISKINLGVGYQVTK